MEILYIWTIIPGCTEADLRQMLDGVWVSSGFVFLQSVTVTDGIVNSLHSVVSAAAPTCVHRPIHIYSRYHTSYSRRMKLCSHWLAYHCKWQNVFCAQPVSVLNHVQARRSLIERSVMWLATESGWAQSKRSAICSGKLCGGFIILGHCCPVLGWHNGALRRALDLWFSGRTFKSQFGTAAWQP